MFVFLRVNILEFIKYRIQFLEKMETFFLTDGSGFSMSALLSRPWGFVFSVSYYQ